MSFTAYLKTILRDLLPKKNQHAQRHGNKASGRNGSRKGSHQHKTMLPQKGQHQGTTTTRTTQEKKNHRYLPPNPPNAPPNSPRPRPIRLPQNPPPAPPPSPRPRPIRLGLHSGEPQANNAAQVEANIKSIPIWPASAPAASLPPPNLSKPPRLPRLQDPMSSFPVTAFTSRSQDPPAQGLVQAQQTQTKPLAQQQQHHHQEREQQETDFLTLLSLLDSALRHTHYAVCGRAALYVWGYRQASSDAPPEEVSIVCLDGNEAILLSWAQAQGWTSNVGSSAKGCCSFEVPIPGRGGKHSGKVRAVVVTVKTAERMGLTLPNFGDGNGNGNGGNDPGMGMPMSVKGTWDEAEKKVLKTQAAVVTLPALLEMLIEGFVTAVTSTHTRTHARQQQQQQTHQVEEAANSILWVLSRLVERGERLSQDKVPEEFLTPFLAGWPEAHTLLEKLGVSSTFEAFDRYGALIQPTISQPDLPLDAVTLAALEGLPPVPPVPPKAPERMMMMPLALLPVRMASPASSCASSSSEDTIALIENEIENWKCLSLEEQSVETSSLVSRVDSAAESSGIWTPACSYSTMASSIASVPALSFSASSMSSKKSGTRSSSGRSTIKRDQPPPKGHWNERFVTKREYPKWI